MKFEGKVAVVTGAAQGIGEAYAHGLAAEGAAIVVADLSPKGKDVADAINADGGRAIFVETDVSSAESANAMAERAVAELGGIDLLVNNAAIYGDMAFDLLITVDWDYYRKFMSVNMDGALVMTRAVYAHMQARGGGAIVNQSSTAAWLYAGFYALAKVGINGLTQQLAHELGGMNIRVNAIAPGPTDTEATRKQAGAASKRAGQGDGAEADGHSAGHGRRLPVPALRRGVLGDRPGRQRRRRSGLQMTEFQMRASRLRRAGQHRQADGAAARWRDPTIVGVRRRAGAAGRAGEGRCSAWRATWPSSPGTSTCSA